jgi:hypothetical protein
MECWQRYNGQYTYVSHEAKVQRPLLHPAEGPLRVGASGIPLASVERVKTRYPLDGVTPVPA